MSDYLILEGEITEDGRLLVELPPDAPRGQVQITVKKATPTVVPELTPEEAAELEELLSDENLRGLGQTAAEIADAPEIGCLDTEDATDGETYVENLRGRKRYQW